MIDYKSIVIDKTLRFIPVLFTYAMLTHRPLGGVAVILNVKFSNLLYSTVGRTHL